jgi:hypothetical protein
MILKQISKGDNHYLMKQLGQMEPNLAGSIYVRSSIQLLHLVPFGQQTWPLLLKIKLTDGRWTPSDGNTSHDPLGQVSYKDGSIALKDHWHSHFVHAPRNDTPWQSNFYN